MLAEEVKIRFSGFEPTYDVRSTVYHLLDQMHLRVPSKSLLTATFTLTNGVFEGVIKVTSVAEQFVVNARDTQLSALGSKLAEKLGAQLDNWRKLRFE
ncbi:MAG: hypothetical protein AB7G93_23010 [Bdellovibrionales bacterium]